jgi:hypothetical protein
VDTFLRGVGLLCFGVAATWLLSSLLMRLVTRRGMALWIWHRSGSVGRVMVAAGVALALLGLAQGEGSTGTSLILLGGLLLMVGTWLVM